MEFSPYTLAGHTFLGGGVELTPGRFRFAALYGRFQRAAATNAGQEYFLPTYKPKGYGVKLGDTKTSNHGLNFGIGKPFDKDQLNLNANTTFNLARLKGASDGNIINN